MGTMFSCGGPDSLSERMPQGINLQTPLFKSLFSFLCEFFFFEIFVKMCMLAYFIFSTFLSFSLFFFLNACLTGFLCQQLPKCNTPRGVSIALFGSRSVSVPAFQRSFCTYQLQFYPGCEGFMLSGVAITTRWPV